MATLTMEHGKITCLLAFIVASTTVLSQNLVPNGGFEEVLECPDLQSQLDRTSHWFDPSEMGTPDYYHACGEPWYSVPDNTVGFQEPVDGQAYVGIFLWIYLLEDMREMIEVELLSTLQAGQCYRFRMHANLGDFSQKTTDDLGVFFSDSAFVTPTAEPPALQPHIALAPGTLLNKSDWTVLEGEYIASGGERYLMIGNYLLDAQTTLVEDTGGTGNFVYCHIDSVSLTPCGAIALGVEEEGMSIVAGPMPFQDRLDVRMERAPGGTYRVTDMQGRLVRIGDAATAHVETSSWPVGPYVIEVRSREGRIWRRVAVKR